MELFAKTFKPSIISKKLHLRYLVLYKPLIPMSHVVVLMLLLSDFRSSNLAEI